ncbi:lipoyl(octanoyl) transferase LipB [Marinomonas mediterranea]|jgi:lipoate-protein ligase B|uniref:Octanoyltransferase n=1 Tax=Marinomonas mediterranea (strain ATCC 700492 / JCM 21426 / NBRC 103028 / MMB-1) TaxID=717774 RepID=F2JY12_MARM1|nr:lipoyl(octanoyl) transferase LipB [Marinomonas mediterranea]ADZ90748.1 Octanoyltransferase [Marinomonas mediterranea MMB-1]WCN11381.1 lipoyl(octanoyl) transferase LipB [Marinomonas mediterranea]WCN15449.1 lipoyl(octanoyl) transferase LipB [Marinomonas mediterranea]WCN16903.1 lipoyl(octanoyl) transferase LipB [Marinomonas mediterranea MMB-1]
MSKELIVRDIGLVEYEKTWEEMKDFTQTRTKEQPDQIWLLEHPPLFTQGQAGKEEHLIETGDIPVIQADRGGQVTYHGPGQLIAYVMIDLKRLGMGVRELVSALENAVAAVLKKYDIDAYPKPDAPGVYVNEMKVSSLGLRVRRGCSFHGLALNVDMDLTPFLRINPCGYQGLQMIDMKRLNSTVLMSDVKKDMALELATHLGFQSPMIQKG